MTFPSLPRRIRFYLNTGVANVARERINGRIRTIATLERFLRRSILDQDYLVQVHLHGHRRRKCSDYERGRNNEPRYRRQPNTTERVQQVYEEESNHQLDRKRYPETESQIKSKLDD